MRGQMTHLDTDVLAEFRAGLITGRRGARIAAHLAGCDPCTAMDDQLAGVSALLASVPAPVMADRLAQRLDTVLAAEVARRDNPERARGDGAGESAAPGRPGGGHRDHRGFRLATWRVLVPAGAAVVLAAGGFGLSQIGHGAGSETAASSAGSAVRASASSASSAKSAIGRLNPSVSSPAKGAAPRPLRTTGANFSLATSQADFSRATFKQQVEAELRAPRAASGTNQAPSAPLRGCVQSLARGDPVQLVESARFEGQPAFLIVARTGQDDTAWITPADCSATNSHVLATTSVPAGISEP
jgi:hypothetical protein